MNDKDLWEDIEHHKHIAHELQKLYIVCYNPDETISNKVHEIALGSINSIYNEIIAGKTFNNIIKSYKEN